MLHRKCRATIDELTEKVLQLEDKNRGLEAKLDSTSDLLSAKEEINSCHAEVLRKIASRVRDTDGHIAELLTEYDTNLVPLMRRPLLQITIAISFSRVSNSDYKRIIRRLPAMSKKIRDDHTLSLLSPSIEVHGIDEGIARIEIISRYNGDFGDRCAALVSFTRRFCGTKAVVIANNVEPELKQATILAVFG